MTSAHILYMETFVVLPLLGIEKAHFFVNSFDVNELHCHFFDLPISRHTEHKLINKY